MTTGQGFSPEILTRLGEPYVSARAGGRAGSQRKEGMGLGFFIAKTLLEGTGAKVQFDNRQWGEETRPERRQHYFNLAAFCPFSAANRLIKRAKKSI